MPDDNIDEDAPDDVQISFRAPYDLKVRFEQALLYRGVRQKRKATATKVLIEQVEAFIENEDKLRAQADEKVRT